MGSSQEQVARIMAIDLGKTRVGIAVSDELGLYAHPRDPIPGDSPKELAAAVARLAKEEGVTRFVVGIPLSMDGRQGVAARRAARFCQRLADVSGLEVETVDERLTSIQARAELDASGVEGRAQTARVDGVAAALMLQQWLDARRET